MTKARQNETPPGPPTAADRSWKTEEESDATNPNPVSVDVLDARLDGAKPQRRVFAKEDVSFSDGLMAARYAGSAHAPPAPHRDKTAPIDNVIVEATPVPEIPSRQNTTDVPDVHELLQGTMLTPPAPQSRAAAPPDSDPRPALLASRHDKTVLGPRAEARRSRLALIALACTVLGAVGVAAFMAAGRRAQGTDTSPSATTATATVSAVSTQATPPTATTTAQPPATAQTTATTAATPTTAAPTPTTSAARPPGSQAPKGASSGPGLTKGDVPWTID